MTGLFSIDRAGLRGGALLLPGLAAAMLVTAMAAPATAQFAVYPIVLTMSPESDAETINSVWVRNDGAGEREFRFEIQDFDQDSVGTPRFLPRGSHPNSCGDRLDVYPAVAILAAGETQELRVTLTGSADVCWAALFAEARSDEQGGIVARQQIGVRVNGVPPGTVLDGEITRLEVEGSSERLLQVWFHNAGEAPIRPVGQVEIRDEEDRLVTTVEVEAFSVLPRRTRRIAVALPSSLPAGTYRVIQVLDFGGDYLAGAQTGFVVR